MNYLTPDCGHHCGAIQAIGTDTVIVGHCPCDECHGRKGISYGNPA
jgi:hypothetical protein